MTIGQVLARAAFDQQNPALAIEAKFADTAALAMPVQPVAYPGLVGIKRIVASQALGHQPADLVIGHARSQDVCQFRKQANEFRVGRQ